jgi:hypothetical protein
MLRPRRADTEADVALSTAAPPVLDPIDDLDEVSGRRRAHDLAKRLLVREP